MQLDVGSYTGNASNPRTISISVGGTPDSVMVKADASASALYWRTEDMAANESHQITSDGTSTTAITSLGSNEFTVNSTLNANGVTYYYVAIRDNGEGDFAVGSYTGNGTSQSINAGFQAIVAITSGDASDGLMGTDSQGNGEGQHLNDSTQITSGGFTFDAQGFDVGNNSYINYNGEDYYYMAFKANGCYEGSYTGNDTDNRDISGVGFTPVFVLTAGDASAPWYRFGSTGDNSFSLQNALASNGIQSFGSDGFQIGDNGSINYSGEDYFFIALYTSESAGTTRPLPQRVLSGCFSGPLGGPL